MVTNDIMTLPSILLTKTYYILREETTYTYDKDDNNQSEELSETGKFKKKTSQTLSLFEENCINPNQ